jgi:hypothetical protein
LEPDEFKEVDLAEMQEWKKRNQKERDEMLERYAKWLKANGVLRHTK